jgi:hypothetical protein
MAPTGLIPSPEHCTDRGRSRTIALEALLLPYDENARRGDLGYRFRVHGAHYLCEHADERPEVAKQLSRVYEMRSRLVHGAKYPDRVHIRAVHDLAYDFAGRGLLRAVREGFPRQRCSTKWSSAELARCGGALSMSRVRREPRRHLQPEHPGQLRGQPAHLHHDPQDRRRHGAGRQFPLALGAQHRP